MPDARDVGRVDTEPRGHEVVDCNRVRQYHVDVDLAAVAAAAALSNWQLRALAARVEAAPDPRRALLNFMTPTRPRTRSRSRTRGIRRVRRVNRCRSGRSPDDPHIDKPPGAPGTPAMEGGGS